jgi:putative PEP-CTERM system histidine kinase
MLIDIIGQWSHALTAILFGALCLWQVRRGFADPQIRILAIACALTAFWGLAAAIDGPASMLARLAEETRNLGWFAFMAMLWRSGGGGRGISVLALYSVLGLVVIGQSAVDLLPPLFANAPRVLDAVSQASFVLGMMVAVGALMLVHNLYTAATPDARTAIRLPMTALAVMWIYDLNLYTVAYLSKAWSGELLALRGVAMTLIAPVFALAAQRSGPMVMRLSRTAAFQSLSLVAIGGYLVFMVVVTSMLDLLGGSYARTFQISFVFGTSVAALVLLPSAKFRAWFRVKLAKHLFQHRYDYRAEWLRFTNTLGKPDENSSPLATRVVKAVADITESPGGVLLVPDDAGVLISQTQWNWSSLDVPAHAGGPDVTRYFGETGRIVELDPIRATDDIDDAEAVYVPEWLMVEPRAWAMVPLVHFGKLAGLVVLERPMIDRTLDWEDFDLLRVVGRQVASYLAEARGQEALSDVRRFDEFNRRFAFIMHDIKNLVSQLSLVTRNAERHADNPEFRADMIATLKNSTARMNDLLARLSQHNKGRSEDPRPVPLGPILVGVVAAKRSTHPVVAGGEPGLFIMADPFRLEQALGHLVQNAIDASPRNEPVLLSAELQNEEVRIDVRDVGTGMTADFVRHQLFKPFASTKESGFGVGAFEARSLIMAMGGRITVDSRPGEGSRFSVFLPVALQPAAAARNSGPPDLQRVA